VDALASLERLLERLSNPGMPGDQIQRLIGRAARLAALLRSAPGERAKTYKSSSSIRAKLRPLERAAFFEAYGNKRLKNIIQGASGAFGNAATRLAAFVVKGGAYSYGSYPEIDDLFEQQAAEPYEDMTIKSG
jgi:hypothetical protein